MSLLILAYCLLLRALDALHHQKAVVAFSPNAAAASLRNGSGDQLTERAISRSIGSALVRQQTDL